MAQSHKKLIANFIRWADGVGDEEWCSAAPCSTNIKEDLDPAIRDRVRMSVVFDLPSEPQCTAWWARHARQLTAPGEHARLGRLSIGLSYRNLWSISNKIVRRESPKADPEKRLGEPACLKYCQENRRFREENLESFQQMARRWIKTAGEGIYTFTNLLWQFETLA